MNRTLSFHRRSEYALEGGGPFTIDVSIIYEAKDSGGIAQSPSRPPGKGTRPSIPNRSSIVSNSQ